MIMEKKRLMIDSHVHIYPCFNLETFFDTAVKTLEHYYDTLYANGNPYEKILLLTEAKTNDFFSQFKEKGSFPDESGYRFLETGEEAAIVLAKGTQRLCYLFRGRQIVTVENLEVLTIGSNQTIKDGLAIEKVLECLREKKEMAVIPWGFGKWSFERGKYLKRVIERHRSPYLLVGDNSGRPGFWPLPRVFKQARALNIPIINGSDPLPFAGEERKAGSYGFSVVGEFNENEPVKSLRDILTAPDPAINYFGKRDNIVTFFMRQSRIYSQKYLKR